MKSVDARQGNIWKSRVIFFCGRGDLHERFVESKEKEECCVIGKWRVCVNIQSIVNHCEMLNRIVIKKALGGRKLSRRIIEAQVKVGDLKREKSIELVSKANPSCSKNETFLISDNYRYFNEASWSYFDYVEHSSTLLS